MKNFLLFVSLFLMISCQQNEKQKPENILQIETLIIGQSGAEHLIIRDDSIVLGGTFQNENIGIKNSHENWLNLIQSFKLDDFKSIKQGKEHINYDGTDETITVTTDKGEYKILNPYEDKKNYPKIEAFSTKLNEIRQNLINIQTKK